MNLKVLISAQFESSFSSPSTEKHPVDLPGGPVVRICLAVHGMQFNDSDKLQLEFTMKAAP